MFVSITGATGAIVAQSVDVVGVVRNGAGDYSITIDQGYTAAASVFVATARTANSTDRAAIVHTSATVKQLLTALGAVGTDQDVDVLGIKQL